MRHRITVMGIAVVVSLLLASQLEFETDVLALLPKNDPTVEAFRDALKNKNNFDPVVIETVEGLDAAAIECVRGWRFRPAEKDGQAVQTIAQAPITFRLSPPSGPIAEDEV